MRDVRLSDHPLLEVAVIQAAVRPAASGESLRALLAGGGERPAEFPADADARAPTYQAARALLRHSGYKPSGRNKPASEYLNKVFTTHGAVNSINNVVDVNNVVSLFSGLPISVFDADLLHGALDIAPGAPGETYVFNTSGQHLDLSNLLTVYHRPDGTRVPAGNAVKDSMATKVSDATRNVLAVIYSNREAIDRAYLSAAASWYADLLERACGGTAVDTVVLPHDE